MDPPLIVGGLLFKEDTLDQDPPVGCCLANPYLYMVRVEHVEVWEHWAHEEHWELQDQDPPMLFGNIYMI